MSPIFCSLTQRMEGMAKQIWDCHFIGLDIVALRLAKKRIKPKYLIEILAMSNFVSTLSLYCCIKFAKSDLSWPSKLNTVYLNFLLSRKIFLKWDDFRL